MKVLVTGGYGFIGSHVVEKFFKEGHKVYVIDNLSTGNVENVNCRHKFYNLDIEDKKCEEVFKSNKFDIVVHLAAQINVVSSIENPFDDTKTNILGITNMLDLSCKYGVNKFIFASSAAVYGNNSEIPLTEESACNPLSPYGMSKLTGELYCKKWSDLYGLNTVCFRFSNVFGPRQGTIGEGGVVSIYLERVFEDKELLVFGDGNQTRDFIYVEDVAEAIYKSSKGKIKGVANLSTNTENSVNQLTNILNGFRPLKGVVYKEPRKGDIYRSCMDNTNVRKKLNWKPKFTFEEGLKKTFEWYCTYHNKKSSENVRKKENKAFIDIKALLPYVENLIAFLAVLFIERISSNGISSHIAGLCMMYIIIMAIMYGTRQATISVVLSSSAYLYTILQSGREVISVVYDAKVLLQLAFFIIVGMIIGYTLDRKNRDLQLKTMKHEALEEKFNFISEIHNESRIINAELQNQIIDSENSFGKIFTVVKQLESLNPDKIISSSISVLENIMKSKSVAIFALSSSGKYLRLEGGSANKKLKIPKSIRVKEWTQYTKVLNDNSIFINKQFIPELPVIMGPITNDRKVVGVVAVYKVDFENMSLYYQNLFKVMLGLINSAISRAYRYQEAINDQKFINRTAILKAEIFESIILSKIQSYKMQNTDFSILRINNNSLDIEELSHQVNNVIRDTDYIGVWKNDDLYILLSNSNIEEAGNVMVRLACAGISTSLEKEVPLSA